jgi:hypothetical protein
MRGKSKRSVTEADVRLEYIKGVVWLILGYLYFHFVIMGWAL